MTRDEQLIKAALDMAATHARAAFDARSTSRKGHHSLLDWTDGYDEATRACAAAIRAIAPADVLVEAMKHLHDIINCGNCSGSRQSARLALRALKGGSENGCRLVPGE